MNKDPDIVRRLGKNVSGNKERQNPCKRVEGVERLEEKWKRKNSFLTSGE